MRYADFLQHRNVLIWNDAADYYEERLRLYPMEATMAGDDRYNDQLPNNLTEEFRAAEVAFYQKYLAALSPFAHEHLSAGDQLSSALGSSFNTRQG